MLLGLPIRCWAGGERGRWMRCGRRVAECMYAAIDGAYPIRREDAHDHHQDGHRPQSKMLACGEIVSGRAMYQRRFRTVEDTLHHPQHVARAEDDANGAERTPDMGGCEAAR